MLGDMATAALAIPDELIDAIAQRAAALVSSTPIEDRWLDAREAAAYLAVPLSTIHKLTSARAIPCSQDTPVGKLYFKRSALDAWREGGGRC